MDDQKQLTAVKNKLGCFYSAVMLNEINFTTVENKI
jgi:hypothetical protein